MGLVFNIYLSQEPSLELVLEDVNNNLIIMKDEMGGVYWPLLGINTISNFTDGEGYQIKMGASDELEISGDLIPSNFEMFMSEGWSYIAYLHQYAAGAEYSLGSLEDNLILVKDGAGAVYWPLIGVNALGGGSGMMNPGSGYAVKLYNDATFSYPSVEGGRFI